MGHKVSPLSNRIGFTYRWNARWFAKRRTFGLLLHEDEGIRRHLREALANAAVARIEIERTVNRARVIIHTARPGIVIGRRGADIDRLRDELHSMTGRDMVIDIKEAKNPAIEPQLVAENIAFQLERQIGFRRAMKRAMQMAMSSGAKGVRIRCAGRLGGSEMSRVETYKDGSVPLGTFRAPIEFGFAEAKTTYGRIGVKCWIHKPTLEGLPAAPGAAQAGGGRPAPAAAAAGSSSLLRSSEGAQKSRPAEAPAETGR